MKRHIHSAAACLVSASVLMLTACGEYNESTSSDTGTSSAVSVPASDTPASETAVQTTAAAERENDDMMTISVGDRVLDVHLEENATVEALKELLPMTLDMTELNGNEKYCYLDESLPSSPQKVGSINAGDVMLYGDSCLVVFYESFDTPYTYTRIGHIDDASDLSGILGSGSVTVSFQPSVQEMSFTSQDIRDLSDFIMTRSSSEDLTGRQYDLNADGQWDSSDLALMRRRVREQRDEKTDKI